MHVCLGSRHVISDSFLSSFLAATRLSPKLVGLTRAPSAKVDFDAFELLAREVKEYRKNRLVSLDEFLSMSKEKNTIILDARSTEMYNRKHIKGAIHLDFAEFSQAGLAALIASMDTRILIYCNNNFASPSFQDLQIPDAFVTKGLRPSSRILPQKGATLVSSKRITPAPPKPLTLALNIPTFINLYGYGYKNVYELADLVSVANPAAIFEGTDVPK